MKQFKGAFTALITPLCPDDTLDEEGFTFLICRQLEAGIDGLAFLGTTAESPTLSKEEQLKILKVAAKECKGRTTFIVGTGTNATASTIENTQYAEKIGADAALLIVPYYNKPTQEGIYQHFKSIAESSSIPLIPYNHPGRAGVNIELETFKRLLDIPNIACMKECSVNMNEISEKIEALRKYRPEFSLLTGNDTDILSLMALGGHGTISAASNVIPKKIVELVRFLSFGKLGLAQELHHQLMPLMRALFCETNPIAIKAALDLLGLPSGKCRLPLSGILKENLDELALILVKSEDLTAQKIEYQLS